ncbi:hemolysin-type calcium-binding protein [Serratia sp. FGI94]|uniref:calcium-binding protein n=1 Tax=Serratia sp. FGI94 TaxID=671990 RepID=UPI0002A7331B|nr:calcium-binding protein [Serratia sp. FGI94]AGB82462.1 hemolysin-type calcium-binding protein [Serratia sp. FGI94]
MTEVVRNSQNLARESQAFAQAINSGIVSFLKDRYSLSYATKFSKWGSKHLTKSIAEMASFHRLSEKGHNGTLTVQDIRSFMSDIDSVLTPILSDIGVPNNTPTAELRWSIGNSLKAAKHSIKFAAKVMLAYFDQAKKAIDDFLAENFGMGEPCEKPNEQGPSDGGASDEKQCPIILDLNRDGVIGTTGRDSGTYFDHDGNEFAESTGWVAPEDGLLVLDSNGDGIIDSGNELFGNNATLKDGSKAKNGYELLAEYDDNQDGVIDHQDAIYEKLQVWQDKNDNGIVDDGELLSLADANIAAIGTDYKNSEYVDQHGNAHQQTGNITYTDGSQGISSDVWFDVNKGNSQYVGDVTIADDILKLPFIHGFGNLASFYVAMSKNNELKDLVKQFVADPLGAIKNGLIDNLLYSWANATDIDPGSRGKHFDARKLAVLEAGMGVDYFSKINNSKDPVNTAAPILEKEYQKFLNYVSAQLLAQTAYNADFNLIRLSSQNGELRWNFSAFEKHLTSLQFTDPERYISLRQVFHSYFEYSTDYATERKEIGLAPENSFIGDDGNNTYTGTSADDIAYGGAGNDKLYGGAGNDTLIGSTGNDYLEGGAGSDTYVIGRGHGQDVIYNRDTGSNKTDVLKFVDGISAAEVTLRREYDNLYFNIAGTNDWVRIDYFFDKDGNSGHAVDEVHFDDGTVWTRQQLLDMKIRSSAMMAIIPIQERQRMILPMAVPATTSCTAALATIP